MESDPSDLSPRVDAIENRLGSARPDDLTRTVQRLEDRVESLQSAVWNAGVVLAVLAVVIGVFVPFAVDTSDDDESRSLAGLVFSVAEAMEDGDSMIVWIPLAVFFLVAVVTAVLMLVLRSRTLSSRWQSIARWTSWLFIAGCLGAFLLLLIAWSRNDDLFVFSPGLLLLVFAATLSALLANAGPAWISEPTVPQYRRL